MRIKTIKINNFRMLKSFSIDIEEELSLILGKNNTGKTSFLSILEKFLNKDNNNFSFYDFNINWQKKFAKLFNGNETFKECSNFGIGMEIVIEYNDEDNLSNVSPLILNLDPENNLLVLLYTYSIDYEGLIKLKKEYSEYKTIYFDPDHKEKDILLYLQKNHKDYFDINRFSVDFKDRTIHKEIDKKSVLDKIIRFQKISAKRDVENVDGDKHKSEKTLSSLSSKYYEQRKGRNKDQEIQLNKQLYKTDKQLDSIYKEIFDKVLSKIQRFGGVKENESIVKIISMLESKNILSNNTTVTYEYLERHLPEEYNGLGYMNLINIIFEIEYSIDKLSKITSENPTLADINILFIEEPEAHTHPQMQYIFSQNIKNSIKESIHDEDGTKVLNLQTIITTHSPHIASKSDFKDYKYFYKQNNAVISKNINELESMYGNDKAAFNFIKQYVTLNRAELFFADKAILIEGDTERLLITSMMKKIDKKINEDSKKLLSQNISVIEVGNYSHIFSKFIEFVGIKTLIITDLDTSKTIEKTDKTGNVETKVDGTIKMTTEKCKVEEADCTKNSSLIYYFNSLALSDLLKLDFENKIIIKGENNKWISKEDGKISVVFQIEQEGYTARSFEDAFLGVKKNLKFVINSKDDFTSLKNIDEITLSKSPFEIANECIKDKTGFALDIIYHSSDDIDKWDIPDYIMEGLKWIGK